MYLRQIIFVYTFLYVYRTLGKCLFYDLRYKKKKECFMTKCFIMSYCFNFQQPRNNNIQQRYLGLIYIKSQSKNNSKDFKASLKTHKGIAVLRKLQNITP